MEGDSMRKKIAIMLTLILVAGTYDDPKNIQTEQQMKITIAKFGFR